MAFVLEIDLASSHRINGVRSTRLRIVKRAVGRSADVQKKTKPTTNTSEATKSNLNESRLRKVKSRLLSEGLAADPSFVVPLSALWCLGDVRHWNLRIIGAVSVGGAHQCILCHIDEEKRENDACSGEDNANGSEPFYLNFLFWSHTFKPKGISVEPQLAGIWQLKMMHCIVDGHRDWE